MKRLFCLFMAFSIMLILSLSAFASSRAASGFYYDGYYTLEDSRFVDTSYYQPFSSPIVNDSVSIPDGYTLVAYYLDEGSGSPSFPYEAHYVYGLASNAPFKLSAGSSSIYFSNRNGVSDSFFQIRNYIADDGTRTYFTSGNLGSMANSRIIRFTCFYDTIDSNGNINRPENQVNFTMNTAIIGYNLSVISQINSGDATSVTYYIFPASTAISGGSSSSVVSSTPVSELTEAQQQSFISRGFYAVGRLIDKMNDLITDISSPKVSLSTSSSTRSSGLFNPDSYGVSYEVLGSGRLFPSSGGGGISPTATLSLKDMISSHTGVYASSTLKLVAVVNTANTSFVATFDFAPASIVGGSPVPPTTLQGQVPYPDFDKPNSDFKDLADYLKQLLQAQTDNSARTNSNLIANLMSMPWADYVGTGFGSQLPNLSMYLDSLFDSLFDKYSAPSEEQINLLVNEVNEERAYLREKLAFVADVKSEVFFIQSTFISAGDSPRPFKVTLPDFMMGYTTSEHQEALVRYDLIDNNTRQVMHDVIIVFCTLAVVMHIWHTLPSTVGNMPRD